MNSLFQQKLIWPFLFLFISINCLIAAEKEEPAQISVCSFNIQFLGFTIDRDNEGLAQLLKSKDCDIVVVQELVAPPSEKYLARSELDNFPFFPEDAHYLLNLKAKKRLSPLGTLRVYPPGPEFQTVQEALDALLLNPGLVSFDPIFPEPKATRFFEEMEKAGFKNFMLSDEDTGPNRHHSNLTVSEWWLVFFNPEKLEVAKDLPHGFLDRMRASSDKFQRVPYAFPLRSKNKKFDFVLIPIHFPDSAQKLARRKEFAAIDEWVLENSGKEKDFIIIGDSNIQNKSELALISPRPKGRETWKSLNEDCLPTNTLPQRKNGKPYEQVFYNPEFTTEKELSRNANFTVISLIEEMRGRWAITNAMEPYPGGRISASGATINYNHNKFRTRYSDHNPIRVVFTIPTQDDD